MTSKAFPPPPRHTWFTTLLGVAVILLGGLGSLFSAFALLLAIGKPYANATSDPLGILLIFILPPCVLLTGIGLLPRWRWARWGMILLMAGVFAFGVKSLVAPTHEKASVSRYYSDSQKESIFVQSAVCIAVSGLILLGLFSRPARSEFFPSKSNATPPPLTGETWRVGHQGRDLMFYEERHGGDWRRLAIDGEMLTGRAHHVIYFASPETWQGYPEWAHHRRDEIIARIKSRFSERDYEYKENGTIPHPAVPHASTNPPAPANLSKTDGSILPALVGLLAAAAACFWFAAQGIRDGEIRLTARFSGNHRVHRAETPVLFWTSIGVLGAVGTFSTAAAGWLLLYRIRHIGR